MDNVDVTMDVGEAVSQPERQAALDLWASGAMVRTRISSCEGHGCLTSLGTEALSTIHSHAA